MGPRILPLLAPEQAFGYQVRETPLMKRLNEFDRLRGMALCMMLAHHFWIEWPHLFPRNLCYGLGCMDVFFVMSGFLISMTILRSMPDLSGETDLTSRLERGASSVRAFYIRRIYRIGPTLVFWAIVPVLLSLLPEGQKVMGGTSALWRDAVAGLTMQASYNVRAQTLLCVYWSLSVEEQFYAVIPLAFLAFPSIPACSLQYRSAKSICASSMGS